MKLPWRRASDKESQEPASPPAIDVSLPRECVYKNFKDQPGPCPNCGSPLHQSHQSYLVITKREDQLTDPLMIGNDMGWFCRQCPTVVINPQEIDSYLELSLPRWDVGDEFALTGLIDLDAVPEDKQHLPLGHDDNPIPLIEFTNVSDETQTRHAKSPNPSPPQQPIKFEEQYKDVLQNIEFGIVRVYRQHPDLVDWDALNAIEALIRQYNAEVKGRQPHPRPLHGLAQEVYDSVAPLCELRLGREQLLDEDDEPVDLPMEPISLEEMIACLKRIRKSINLWTQEGGRQGYLEYVNRFIA